MRTLAVKAAQTPEYFERDRRLAKIVSGSAFLKLRWRNDV